MPATMDPYANAGCVLKMNVKCQTCITKLMDALSSICGVYTVNIDAEQGTVDISGQVDPNSLLLTLLRSGEHAELVRVKLQHPAVGQSSSYHDNHNVNGKNNYGRLAWSGGYNNYNNGNSYGYGINDPYLYDQRRPLLGNYDEPSYYYPSPSDYYSWPHNRNYAYDPQPLMPPARYVPSGPPAPDYNPYDDEPLGFCSVM